MLYKIHKFSEIVSKNNFSSPIEYFDFISKKFGGKLSKNQQKVLEVFLSYGNEKDSVIEEEELKTLYKTIKKEVKLLKDFINEIKPFVFFNLRSSFPYLLALDERELIEENYSNIYIKSSWLSPYSRYYSLEKLIKKVEEELSLDGISKDLLFIDPSGSLVSKALYSISCYFIGIKLDDLSNLAIIYQTNQGDIFNLSLEEFYRQHLSHFLEKRSLYFPPSKIPLEGFKRLLKKENLPKEKSKLALYFINALSFLLFPTKTLEKLKELKKEGYCNIIFYNPSTSYENYRLVDDKLFLPYILETEEKAILLPFNPIELENF